MEGLYDLGGSLTEDYFESGLILVLWPKVGAAAALGIVGAGDVGMVYLDPV